MTKLRIALISGGMSSERKVSQKSGDQVFSALDQTRYDIFRYDPKTDLPKLVNDAPNLDMALIILHGPYGEDGRIQGLLDLLGLPYQGSGVLGSALAMNKLAAKNIYEQQGLFVPAYISLTRGCSFSTQNIIETLQLPIVVKPCSGGSSLGMSLAKNQIELEQAVQDAFEEDDLLLLEQYIAGIELTGGVIGNDDLVALPIVEIIPGDEFTFFDYEAKYTTGATSEICPARISPDHEKSAKQIAIAAHKGLYCHGYSRTDMILSDEKLFVLETNTIPGMTQTSLLPIAAREAGMTFSGLLDRLIGLALEKPEK